MDIAPEETTGLNREASIFIFSTTFRNNAITAMSKPLGLTLCVRGCVSAFQKTNSLIREIQAPVMKKVPDVTVEHLGFLSVICNLFFFS